MLYHTEEMTSRREREVTAGTRTPRPALPALSWGKWRHWAGRPYGVYCSRAAAVSGAR